MEEVPVKDLKTSDRYNVVIKDKIIYATVNGFEFEMSIDDYEKFDLMVHQALKGNMNASYIDDAGYAHSLNKLPMQKQ